MLSEIDPQHVPVVIVCASEEELRSYVDDLLNIGTCFYVAGNEWQIFTTTRGADVLERMIEQRRANASASRSTEAEAATGR